jgi:hypothetical protein
MSNYPAMLMQTSQTPRYAVKIVGVYPRVHQLDGGGVSFGGGVVGGAC